MPKGTEPLWTTDDVAKYLNKTSKTIIKWVQNGDLKCCPKVPGNELRFDPNYIKSLGEMEFKVGLSSPEVYRLEKRHAREIKERDEIISKLIRMVRGDYIRSTKNINEISLIEEILINS